MQLSRGASQPCWSLFYGHNVCLDLAIHIDRTEALGERLRRDVDRLAKTRGIACLDLVP